MSSDDGNDVPERVVRAFEAVTGLSVCLYDQRQSFTGMRPNAYRLGGGAVGAV